ncbi:uncharacterized protein LOC110890096 isoform X2 [Helianthus annuus]|uniref:uncharacterized protein LOC110890096 isoform X2 n=1 Tax=Helianthus annuus TaxID=4232 RepID=UPI001653066C|nr:uncharacterized protein LOC110890096 isoform X2 [Helianthus annuus]
MALNPMVRALQRPTTINTPSMFFILSFWICVDVRGDGETLSQVVSSQGKKCLCLVFISSRANHNVAKYSRTSRLGQNGFNWVRVKTGRNQNKFGSRWILAKIVSTSARRY